MKETNNKRTNKAKTKEKISWVEHITPPGQDILKSPPLFYFKVPSGQTSVATPVIISGRALTRALKEHVIRSLFILIRLMAGHASLDHCRRQRKWCIDRATAQSPYTTVSWPESSDAASAYHAGTVRKGWVVCAIRRAVFSSLVVP